jgi:hypothetical protein
MEQVMTVKRIAERYGCTTKTAAKYIRQMVPHMENPISAPMFAFHEWEEKRTVYPAEVSKSRKEELTKRQTGRVIVPRHR